MSNLGQSGLKLTSPIIVGCMTYGSKSWADWVIDDKEKVFEILKKCYDSGLRTFDTADVYSNGRSEELLGEFIKKYDIPRERIVILTKLNFATDSQHPEFNMRDIGTKYPAIDYVNSKGSSRKHVFDAVEASVKRLGTFIDVLQIHRLDNTTPKKEIMRSLNDVVDQGFTRYIGASSMKTYEFAELQFIAEQKNWHKFISMQNYYNLIYREEEREMIPFCQNSEFQKVGLIPWSPIARGILAKTLGEQSTRSKSDKTFDMLNLNELTEADKEIIKRVEEVAKNNKVSMAVVATAWVIGKGHFPIVGLSSTERVDDILKATEFKLSPEDEKYLEDPYQPKKALF